MLFFPVSLSNSVIKLLVIILHVVVLNLYNPPVIAERFKLAVGAEYTSGDYGGDQSIDEWYMPITGKYITDRYVFRLTVPYIQLTAPVGTTISSSTNSQVIKTGSGERITVQGLGDIIAGITFLDVLDSEPSSGLSLDLTGKIKFATANEDEGLGTGENDYTLQAELFKFYDHFYHYGFIGHVFRGEPPGISLSDSWFGLVGTKRRFTSNLKAGLDLYFREASISSSPDQKELTVLLDFRVSKDNKLQGYFLRGLSDASPDWGVGIIFSVTR